MDDQSKTERKVIDEMNAPHETTAITKDHPIFDTTPQAVQPVSCTTVPLSSLFPPPSPRPSSLTPPPHVEEPISGTTPQAARQPISGTTPQTAGEPISGTTPQAAGQPISGTTPHGKQPICDAKQLIFGSSAHKPRGKMDELDLLHEQMFVYMEALQREGYVDSSFKSCYEMKEGLTSFMELVPMFLTDAGTMLDEMTDILEYPIFNSEKLFSVSIKLKGASLSIGACRLSSECSALIEAIRNKLECEQIVTNLKNEKATLEYKWQYIMKLEHEIIDLQKGLDLQLQ